MVKPFISFKEIEIKQPIAGRCCWPSKSTRRNIVIIRICQVFICCQTSLNVLHSQYSIVHTVALAARVQLWKLEGTASTVLPGRAGEAGQCRINGRVQKCEEEMKRKAMSGPSGPRCTISHQTLICGRVFFLGGFRTPANSGNQRYIRCMTLGLANSQPGRRSWNHTHMLPLSLVSLVALKTKMDKGIIITNNPFTV